MIRQVTKSDGNQSLWGTPLPERSGQVDSVTERNRRNARRSTGPRTLAGKQQSRGNSLKHGLCANPAAGVLEDPEQFNELHRELVDRLEPADAIEAGLVHRIAVSLWRLQRAATADAAATELSVRAVVPHRMQVQEWIEQIHDAWRAEPRSYFDAALQREQREDGHPHPDGRRWRMVRPALRSMDRLREQEMMRSAAAITAMGVVLEDLMDRLRHDPRFFGPIDAEQLAWLLGERATALFEHRRHSILIVQEPVEAFQEGFWSRFRKVWKPGRQRQPRWFERLRFTTEQVTHDAGSKGLSVNFVANLALQRKMHERFDQTVSEMLRIRMRLPVQVCGPAIGSG